MDSFMIALLLTFAIALGGRDQLVIGQFADQLERTFGLLIVGVMCAVASAALMGVAGWSLAALLPPRAADMLVALALGIAAIELGWKVRPSPMKEPTRSYIAIGAVIFARQLGDAARFAIFAVAAGAVYPAATILGGALGGSAAVALGWYAGRAKMETWPLYRIRVALGLALIVAALFIGLDARYRVY